MNDIELGDEVEDVITGFRGVAIQRLESVFQVTEIAVQQRNLNGDERPLDKIWFAEAQLRRVKKSLAFGPDLGGCNVTEEEIRKAVDEAGANQG